MILGGAFEQEGSGGKGGAGGTLHYVRGNYKSSKGTNLTIVARRHAFISPAWYCLVLFIILEDLMLDGQKYSEVISVCHRFLPTSTVQQSLQQSTRTKYCGNIFFSSIVFPLVTACDSSRLIRTNSSAFRSLCYSQAKTRATYDTDSTFSPKKF